MFRSVLVSGLALVGCTSGPPDAPEIPLSVEPYVFEANDGTQVQAEKGVIEVPEMRGDPGSRTIPLTFVRFPSTAENPGAPIIYLAGGPGGSGVATAEGARFEIFMALREVADVIALDQRGTGMSNIVPACDPETAMPATMLTRDSLVGYYRAGLSECFDWWTQQGVGIDGYTTAASAQDVADLRDALGVERVNLWGISYGSHLGLAIMKLHPEIVERAVFAGIEGLDETVKRPALTDAYLARMQARIDADTKASAYYPDLAGLMRSVHDELNATPAVGSVRVPGSDETLSVTFDGFAVQLLASTSVADPAGFARIPLLYLALANGQYDMSAGFLYQGLAGQAAQFRGMPEAMDLASGISAERLALVRAEAETAVLGDALNFPMPHILGVRPGIDLGEDFRSDFTSDAPVLLISGTLDGRTYPEASAALVGSFANGERLVVDGGGHNIFEADARVADAVVRFFRGEAVPQTLSLDVPPFATP